MPTRSTFGRPAAGPEGAALAALGDPVGALVSGVLAEPAGAVGAELAAAATGASPSSVVARRTSAAAIPATRDVITCMTNSYMPDHRQD
ncbi:hypothetical protein [Metallococcus carri]|uniref:hypothetical protein n=1 Tax=Metallococcus carri TaxID=1656884 RepID=UPI001F28044E|nr:hypothetical protein [Metallococcus carri]